jgi:hypothetical protein
LTIVAEGQTEAGFIATIFKRTVSQSLYERGVWITDGQGRGCRCFARPSRAFPAVPP